MSQALRNSYTFGLAEEFDRAPFHRSHPVAPAMEERREFDPVAFHRSHTVAASVKTKGGRSKQGNWYAAPAGRTRLFACCWKADPSDYEADRN